MEESKIYQNKTYNEIKKYLTGDVLDKSPTNIIN